MKTQHPRNLITFLGDADSTAVALAKLGLGDKVITDECHLSVGQISYRLRKAQQLEGTSGGYRRAWSNGTSEVAQMVRRDLMAILKQEVQRSLPKLIAHPPPQFVTVKDKPAPTVDQAVAQLKKNKAGMP